MALPSTLGDIGGFVGVMHLWEYLFPLRLARTQLNLQLRATSDPPLSTFPPLLGHLSLLGSPPVSRGPFPLNFDWMADSDAGALGMSISYPSLPVATFRQ